MRARDVRRAQVALSWMQADGVKPDEITFNTLIKVGAAGGGWRGWTQAALRRQAGGRPGSWKCLSTPSLAAPALNRLPTLSPAPLTPPPPHPPSAGALVLARL